MAASAHSPTSATASARIAAERVSVLVTGTVGQTLGAARTTVSVGSVSFVTRSAAAQCSRPGAQRCSVPGMKIRHLAPLLASAALLLCAGTAATASPVAHAAHTCSTPSYPGAGYYFELHVSGTSCNRGTQVANDQYRCRQRHGKAGTCPSVDGYRCSEGHRNAIPTEFDVRTTCRKSHATILFAYQQDT
jgi:hypothetical protein